METSQFKFPFFPRRFWAVAGTLFLILATAFVAARTWKNAATPANEFDWDQRGMSDFYTIYAYSKAFSDGVNPYSESIMQRPEYVVPRAAAPFSPFIFLIDQPLTWISINSAMVVYFVFNWILLGALAWSCLRISRLNFDWALWIWIFGFLVFSRPGHISLFTGYFTIQLVLGTLTALHFSKTKPWLAAIGLAIASIKPTYAIPLCILMLCRRDFKAVFMGALLSSVIAIGCLAWLASHSDVATVITGIQSGQEAFHEDPTQLPINTWTRVDVAGMVAKVMQRAPGTIEYFATMIVLLIVPGIAIWKASSAESKFAGAGSLSALIVLLATLVTLYHHSYDCLLVSASIFGLLLNSKKMMPSMPRTASLSIGLLVLVPMLNYVSTQSIRDKAGFDPLGLAWQSITMINGICLTTALIVAVYFALQPAAKIETEAQ